MLCNMFRVYEKFCSWTDNNGAPEHALSQDQILDNISLHWFTYQAQGICSRLIGVMAASHVERQGEFLAAAGRRAPCTFETTYELC